MPSARRGFLKQNFLLLVLITSCCVCWEMSGHGSSKPASAVLPCRAVPLSTRASPGTVSLRWGHRCAPRRGPKQSRKWTVGNKAASGIHATADELRKSLLLPPAQPAGSQQHTEYLAFMHDRRTWGPRGKIPGAAHLELDVVGVDDLLTFSHGLRYVILRDDPRGARVARGQGCLLACQARACRSSAAHEVCRHRCRLP